MSSDSRRKTARRDIGYELVSSAAQLSAFHVFAACLFWQLDSCRLGLCDLRLFQAHLQPCVESIGAPKQPVSDLGWRGYGALLNPVLDGSGGYEKDVSDVLYG